MKKIKTEKTYRIDLTSSEYMTIMKALKYYTQSKEYRNEQYLNADYLLSVMKGEYEE